MKAPHRLSFRAQPLKYPSWLACQRSLYATVAAASTPAPQSVPPSARYPQSQLPSHKRPEFRKSQLLRQYASLLRSSPLMLLLQHSNLQSNEWMAIRRELVQALRRADERPDGTAGSTGVSEGARLRIIQTGIFAVALRVVEYYRPMSEEEPPGSAQMENTSPDASPLTLTHLLSRRAWRAGTNARHRHPLEPLLTGPLAILTIPTVSPAHLAATLTILSPSKSFPAPRRKTNPSYYDPSVQAGLSKLLLLGARIEGRVLDADGVRSVGSIDGGLIGLRAQLVDILTGVGGGLSMTIAGVGSSLYVTLRGRRDILRSMEKGSAGA